MAFLSSTREYPTLAGAQTNLFKNFLVRAWELVGIAGTGGFLHPESPYDEVKAELLRKFYYPRLLGHYQFVNELALFADVHHNTSFSVNIFGPEKTSIAFKNVCNLYHPSTLTTCLRGVRDDRETPGLKTDDGRWELRGHWRRVVDVTDRELKVFSRLFSGSAESYSTTQIPQIHSKDLMELLTAISSCSSVKDKYPEVDVSRYFEEAAGQRGGVITRQDSPSFQPTTSNHVILSGPLFFVGNPAYKKVRTNSKLNSDYDELDLTTLSATYLPRTIYRPGNREGGMDAFLSFISSCSASISSYRLAFRKMTSPSLERSLVAAVVPPGFTGIDAVLFCVEKSPRNLLTFAGMSFSLIGDFLVRAKGRSNIYKEDIVTLPVGLPRYQPAIIARALLLSSITEHYAELWSTMAPEVAKEGGFENIDIATWSCSNVEFSAWSPAVALRTELSRRQALLQLDVLVALSLGISLASLKALYRLQFPIFRTYEGVDEYDCKGRRLPNTTRKSQGSQEVRKAREKHDGISPLTVSWEIDNGNETVTRTFYPPFVKVDREADYAQTYEIFKKRYG